MGRRRGRAAGIGCTPPPVSASVKSALHGPLPLSARRTRAPYRGGTASPGPQARRSRCRGTREGWAGAWRVACSRDGHDAVEPGVRLARPAWWWRAAATDTLAWAVREIDAAGPEGAVRFFVGEHFTVRHPKKRRVGATARDTVLRRALARPGRVAVLERRLLRAAEDRVRR